MVIYCIWIAILSRSSKVLIMRNRNTFYGFHLRWFHSLNFWDYFQNKFIILDNGFNRGKWKSYRFRRVMAFSMQSILLFFSSGIVFIFYNLMNAQKISGHFINFQLFKMISAFDSTVLKWFLHKLTSLDQNGFAFREGFFGELIAKACSKFSNPRNKAISNERKSIWLWNVDYEGFSQKHDEMNFANAHCAKRKVSIYELSTNRLHLFGTRNVHQYLMACLILVAAQFHIQGDECM